MNYDRYMMIKDLLAKGTEMPYSDWLVWKEYDKLYNSDLSAKTLTQITKCSTYNRSNRYHARSCDIDYMLANAIENIDNFSISIDTYDL